MCHSHSHDVIPIPTSIPISRQKAIPMHPHGIAMGIPILMHTSTLMVKSDEQLLSSTTCDYHITKYPLGRSDSRVTDNKVAQCSTGRE